MEKKELQWEAPEFDYREREVSWYWISIIVAAIMIAFAVWQKNFLFGIFVIIAEILVIIWGNNTPRLITFIFNEKGVGIKNGKFYPFAEMENFSIDRAPDGEMWDDVFFHFRGRFKLPMKIKFPKKQIERVQKDMKEVIKEIEYEPTFFDSLEKLIGF
jgi:hypothetical protein